MWSTATKTTNVLRPLRNLRASVQGSGSIHPGGKRHTTSCVVPNRSAHTQRKGWLPGGRNQGDLRHVGYAGSTKQRNVATSANAKLSGEVAIVTGGARGIGKAVAEKLSSLGAKVVVADLPNVQREGEQLAAQLNDGTYIPVDVTKSDDVENMVKRTVEKYGSLGMLVNNAGIVGKAGGDTGECTLENWDNTMKVNLYGVFYGLKYGLPAIRDTAGSGAVVNISSVAGMLGARGLPAYSSSKAGVINLTRSAALDFAKYKIRVNSICPTGVRTPMIAEAYSRLSPEEVEKMLGSMNPIPGVVEPEDIANATVFFLSQDSRYITGTYLPVDGGLTCQIPLTQDVG